MRVSDHDHDESCVCVTYAFRFFWENYWINVTIFVRREKSRRENGGRVEG